MTVEERFWAKVDRSAGPGACWLWTACVDTSGYGLLKVDGRNWKAHRYSLSLVESLKPNLIVLHACDNTRCVNPRHLSQGTRADNNADRDAKGRHVPLLGEAHGMHKLTEESVHLIRAAWPTTSLEQLATSFNVSPSAIHRAATKRTWAHV